MTKFAGRCAALGACVVVSVLVWSAPASAQPQFEEKDGFVVMEMESMPIPAMDNDWQPATRIQEFTGTGYYEFGGNGICNGPANSPLRYTFRITTKSIWELRLRCSRVWHCVEGMPHGNNNNCEEDDRTCTSLGLPEGTTCGGPNECIRTDISNDAFVFIEDEQGDYVEFTNQPNGTNGDPIKLFGGGRDAWGWSGKRALDIRGKHDAHWDLDPGVYTLVMQGRSKSFSIDRIVLFDTQTQRINGAEDLPETLAPPPPPPPMDMGVPPEDMGMGGGEMDMAVVMPDGDMGQGMQPEDMGGQMVAPDMGSGGPGPDAGDEAPDDEDEPDGDGESEVGADGCSASGAGPPAPGGLGWLLVLCAVFGLRRRR